MHIAILYKHYNYRDCEGFKVKNASILGLDLFTQVVRSSDCDAIIIIIDFVDIDLYHYVVHVVYVRNCVVIMVISVHNDDSELTDWTVSVFQMTYIQRLIITALIYHF